MQVETTVSVYSVLTVSKSGDAAQRVDAYLYDHTTVVESHESDRFVFFIVKTTVSDRIDSETRCSVQSSDRDLVREAFYLANYQLGRIASGLGGGILAGSFDEAQALLAEAAAHS